MKLFDFITFLRHRSIPFHRFNSWANNMWLTALVLWMISIWSCLWIKRQSRHAHGRLNLTVIGCDRVSSAHVSAEYGVASQSVKMSSRAEMIHILTYPVTSYSRRWTGLLPPASHPSARLPLPNKSPMSLRATCHSSFKLADTRTWKTHNVFLCVWLSGFSSNKSCCNSRHCHNSCSPLQIPQKRSLMQPVQKKWENAASVCPWRRHKMYSVCQTLCVCSPNPKTNSSLEAQLIVCLICNNVVILLEWQFVG